MGQTEIKDKSIIDFLSSLDGQETKVELKDGRTITVWNIAWGYDIGDEFAHITTNISPNITNSTIDYFYSNAIKNILKKDE